MKVNEGLTASGPASFVATVFAGRSTAPIYSNEPLKAVELGVAAKHSQASSRLFVAPGDKLRLYLVIGCNEAEQPHATEMLVASGGNQMSTAKELAPDGDSGYIFQPPTTLSSLDSRPSDKENTLLQSVCGRRNIQFSAARADLLAETLRSILVTSGGDIVRRILMRDKHAKLR